MTVWVPTEPRRREGVTEEASRRQAVPVPWVHTPVSVTATVDIVSLITSNCDCHKGRSEVSIIFLDMKTNGKRPRSVTNFNKNWKEDFPALVPTHSIYQDSFSLVKLDTLVHRQERGCHLLEEPGEANICHVSPGIILVPKYL